MEIEQLKSQINGFLKANQLQHFTAQNMADGLRMNSASQYQQVVNALNALVHDGDALDDNGQYKHSDHAGYTMGDYRANDKGFGFVKYDAELPDFFINPENTLQAMQGDKVSVSTIKPSPSPDRGPEGKVEEIIEHAYERIVGTFSIGSEAKGMIGELRINDKKAMNFKVLINSNGLMPNDGQVVVAEVTRFPDKIHPRELIAHVTETLGYKDEPGMDILQIVYAKKVPSEFPQEVLDDAAKIPVEVPETEWAGREDITEQTLVTIDGADTKDIDDAVVAWKLDNGNYHLGVHIADVSHYVTEGSTIDNEAYTRGTSVYLTDRVIPMLPRNISNGIASLNPNVVRLAMSAEMEIDPQGRIVNHRLHTSVMKSHARMTYDAVNKILEGDIFVQEEYAQLTPMFKVMGELHEILYKMRKERGAIEFDAPEAQIIVDEDGKAIDIKLRERGTAERMIESFMLAANETVAEHFDKLEVPFLYRIHETPDEERAKSFFEFSKALGHPVYGDPSKVTPSMLQKLMADVAGDPAEQMISTMMLRAMKQAKYSSDPVGHFGLGAQYYTHFTSPIRRYPDLTVHRLIKWYEKHGYGAESQAKYADKLVKIGEDTSTRERRAVDTERDVDALKKAEYMLDKVGLEFNGVVNSALKFGLFISLENTVEGLVHISNLTDDHYEYDESHAALIGRSKHRIFQIGQKVRVKVLRVNKEERTVDFILIDTDSAPTTEIRVASKSNGKFGVGRNRDERRKNERRGKSEGPKQRRGPLDAKQGQKRDSKRNF
ncbi:ribonuclease R [Leuconostoc gelidum subsp. gelidum]|uniref:Ribonuclease R n=1 Tax=Leuconostoc gelidum subsp. gelidum TaxID=1607839 RepID=A0AB35FX91_LEUGE|nr:ribonuclease R [Leuconostoc gelidum]MBZ5964068.1 ribonuclease R [Leuconostoc gelidum subsp. gelidum]MBZ5975891.1 ribonuclease R [Leuconostoc gelidum subsp. gelidum]MBZ5976630.1 ribonuclease R [Leuconostoc gelidum subsp. gelidum]MBZ5986202.1 ribonuclease R [Leuconostoc gelidum subsp. gelidum]MBZ5999892.1 ribonuclease R [Leuconostoc gelidum subsp. gelidum]